jgi:hypothetical protein
MSTSFFHSKGPQMQAVPNLNLEARAIGAPGFSARTSAGAASKDLGAALGINKGRKLGPLAKTSASDAPGPKV